MSKPIDLPDFIPETYPVAFSINKHKYSFEFEEAKIDEVLKLMMENPEKEEDAVDRLRRVVTAFLTRNAPEGTDIAQLEKDLSQVPYKSSRGSLDLTTLYQIIQQRYEPKKSGGVAETPAR